MSRGAILRSFVECPALQIVMAVLFFCQYVSISVCQHLSMSVYVDDVDDVDDVDEVDACV